MLIAQVCKKSGLSADTLRYYEKIGILPKVGRTSGGLRDYSQSDLDWIELIKCMRHAGVSVQSLQEYLRLFELGDATVMARKQILINERRRISAKLTELTKLIERLDYKIEVYDSVIRDFEERLTSGKQRR
jgi:DNA-binding transcriptional MerR regulator